MSTFRQRIKELEDVKVARQQIRAKLRWKQKDYIITKEFFVHIKPKPNKIWISTLKDDVGVITTSQIEMKRICCNFYSKLYKAQEGSSQEWKIAML